MSSVIETLRDILTVRKLASETALTEEQQKQVVSFTDKYLEALLL